MLKKLIALSAVLAVAAAVVPSTAAPTNQNASYVAGSAGDPTLGLCAEEHPTGENVGSVCFPVDGGARYRVTGLDDVLGPDIGFWVYFTDKDGASITDANASGCTSVDAVAPGNARGVVIDLTGPVFGPLYCLDALPGTSTNGTVNLKKVG